MSSPNERLIADDLLRQALAPQAAASPPAGQWVRIIERIQAASAHTGRWAAVEQRIAQIGRRSSGRGAIRWCCGLGALCPVSAHDLIRVAPHRGYWPSPFTDIVVQRVWGLRLAS